MKTPGNSRGLLHFQRSDLLAVAKIVFSYGALCADLVSTQRQRPTVASSIAPNISSFFSDLGACRNFGKQFLAIPAPNNHISIVGDPVRSGGNISIPGEFVRQPGSRGHFQKPYHRRALERIMRMSSSDCLVPKFGDDRLSHRHFGSSRVDVRMRTSFEKLPSRGASSETYRVLRLPSIIIVGYNRINR